LIENFEGYEFIDDKDCPGFYFQKAISKFVETSKKERGTCSLWSLLMIELILLDNTKDYNVIKREAVKFLSEYQYKKKDGKTLDTNPSFVWVMRGMYRDLIDKFKEITGEDITTNHENLRYNSHFKTMVEEYEKKKNYDHSHHYLLKLLKLNCFFGKTQQTPVVGHFQCLVYQIHHAHYKTQKKKKVI